MERQTKLKNFPYNIHERAEQIKNERAYEQGNEPPDDDGDLLREKENVEANSPFNRRYNTSSNTSGAGENRAYDVINRNKPVTNWGQFSLEFDELGRLSGGTPQDKRLVAEAIGLKVSHPTFRRILRDRTTDGSIRPYKHSPYLIQWINREYEPTIIGKAGKLLTLDLKFPLDIHKQALLTPRSVMAVAGTTGGGKTAFMLEFAELNAFTQPLPIYYWYTEGGKEMLELRCEDFPLLLEAQAEGKFIAVEQSDFEIGDVIKPEAINLVDYVDRNDEFYKVGDDINQLYDPLTTGLVIFALQKNPTSKYGYGGIQSAKLTSLYVTLDASGSHAEDNSGKATIVKARYFADLVVNPKDKYCQYRTGGKWGKLLQEGDWKR